MSVHLSIGLIWLVIWADLLVVVDMGVSDDSAVPHTVFRVVYHHYHASIQLIRDVAVTLTLSNDQSLPKTPALRHC